MTDLLQAKSKLISVRRATTILLLAAILGAVAGLAATRLTAASNQSIAVISLGRQDKDTFVEEPLALMERIKSTAFASAVAAHAAIPELSIQLPARQYGGGGAIEARSLRDPGLVEIRINLPQSESAQKAMTAVVEQLIAEHEAKAAPVIANIKSSLPMLEKGVSEMIESRDAITKRLGNLSQDGQAEHEAIALRSALAQTEAGLSSLVRNANDLTTLAANFRKSQIVTAPTGTTTNASAFYRIVAMGTLAGIVIGILLLQLSPGLFRAGRSGAV